MKESILWSLQMVKFAHSMVVVSSICIICYKMIRVSCMKHPSQYADVISRPALDLLSKTDIKISYGVVAPHIINRTATGWCPLETRCFDCATPEECFHQIKVFYKQMKY